MKTKQEFEAQAIREAERKLGVPAGWWGDYHHVRGPHGIEVRYSGRCWTLRQDGKVVSPHNSRSFAIIKGKKLANA